MEISNTDKTDSGSSVDPKSGFCYKTKIYRSVRPPVPLPPETTPISVASYVISLLKSDPPPPTTAALIDAVTRGRIPYSDLIHRIKTLAFSLKTKCNLSKTDVAFVLSENSIHIPVLYLSLLSLGVVVSPSNPSSTKPEISRQIQLSKPAIAFSSSENAHKIPSLKYGTILLDSSEFDSFLTSQFSEIDLNFKLDRVTVFPSDTAAIMYSSGTTGMVKGVTLTHRNWIASVAAGCAFRAARETPPVSFCTVPYFHAYGFGYCLRALAMGQSLVSMGRYDFGVMLRTIEELRVSHVAVAPPLVLKMARDGGLVDGYDLSSLEVVACGGANLTSIVIQKFGERLPTVHLAQAYGLTETASRIFSTVGPKECQVVGATGKLLSNCEAKIVDPETGIAQPPCGPGELWVRGAPVTKGYIDDGGATSAVLDSEGWLRTGDLCCIDNKGYLFFIDRIKELIKCKGYQVAPAELEQLLQSHPDIVDAAVVPFPDEQVGEVPIAFAVRRSGSFIDESQIKDFIAKQVAPYKRLRKVIFTKSIPRNAPGKVLRKELIKNITMSNVTSKL